MKRLFLSLAVLTLIVLLAVVIFVPGSKSPESTSDRDLLMPEVTEQINDIDRVEIVTAGNNVVATLMRSTDGWQLEQMGGYRADWPTLRALLAALAQARVIETKTDKPEYYARLGVEDVAAGDAGSVLVRFGTGEKTTAVLVGHQAEGRSGQYVRIQNEKTSILVDRNIEVPTVLLSWADSSIVDINASEVAEVEVIHPDGEQILVTRVSADQTDFDFVGLPQGRETSSSWAVNSLGSVFSMLNMESVRPAEGVDWSDAVKMRLLLFSGVEIMADLVESGDEKLVRLVASYPQANIVADDEESVSKPAEQKRVEEQAAEDVAETVTAINRDVAGWAYGIAAYKFDAMVKKPEDLLKPLETP